MATFLINNAFRIAISTLNFLSPSIVADILLHPFDFATVLLQIGYDPEGIKHESATIVSVLVQYALFTFYIPYLLTSMQGLQFMGMPHPSIFYYVNYIYNKEGFLGCYRGLMPKVCERLIMVSVSEKLKQRANSDSVRPSLEDIRNEFDKNSFLQSLINNVWSQSFAVLVSHPFHVLMVSSFAEFTYHKKSSLLELSHSIYEDDGCLGFFTGLTARLLGELLSLVFSLAYTTIINKQLRSQQLVVDVPQAPPAQKTAANLVNYVTEVSRFTAFKPKSPNSDTLVGITDGEEPPNRHSKVFAFLKNLLENLTQNHRSRSDQIRNELRNRRTCPMLSYIPLTSKLFYYIMIRDFLSKKISNPFFLVCHCAIVLDTGWDKFPLINYLRPLIDIQTHESFIRKQFFENLYTLIPSQWRKKIT